MKKNLNMPRWVTRPAFIIGVIGAVLFSSCDGDEILPIDPDTEQPGGNGNNGGNEQKDDIFIDLRSNTHDMLQSINLNSDNGTLVMTSKSNLDSDNKTFTAIYDDKSYNAKASMELIFDGEVSYNFYKDKRDQYGVYVDPPAITANLTFEDADADGILLNLDDDNLKHYRVKSVDYAKSIWTSFTVIQWGDYNKVREDKPSYNVFFARQFHHLVQEFNQYGKNVTLEKENAYTKEKENILDEVLALDMDDSKQCNKLFNYMIDAGVRLHLKADEFTFNITDIVDEMDVSSLNIGKDGFVPLTINTP